MRIADYVNANTKKTIKTKNIMNLKKYAIDMYRVYMVDLYNNDFISDPTRLDEKEIYANISDMGISALFSSTGVVMLNTKYIKYAIYRYSKVDSADSDRLTFLNILYNVYKYREYWEAIDLFYDENTFRGNSSASVKLGLRFTGARVGSKNCSGVNKAVCDCFCDSGNHAVRKTFGDKIWHLAMQELGVPSEEWYEDGLFDSNLTHNEEVECMEIILNGCTSGSGKYSGKLEDWLFNHKWKEKGMSLEKVGLFSYLFNNYYSEICSIEGQIVTHEIEEKGNRVVALAGIEYYVEEPIKEYKIPFGCFAVDSSYSDEPFPDASRVSGYTGECYSESYLDAEGIQYIGCPFEVYVDSRSYKLVYDIEQCDIKSDTWFKQYDMKWEFDETFNFRKAASRFHKGTLEYKLLLMYQESINGNLVGSISAEGISLQELSNAKKNIMKVL